MRAAQLDLYIEQGATFTRTLHPMSDGADMDLSTWDARSQIRRSHATSTVEAAFVFTTINNNRFVMQLTPSVTETIRAGTYVYDVEMENSDTGQVIRLLQGAVTVSPEVTRDN